MRILLIALILTSCTSLQPEELDPWEEYLREEQVKADMMNCFRKWGPVVCQSGQYTQLP